MAVKKFRCHCQKIIECYEVMVEAGDAGEAMAEAESIVMVRSGLCDEDQPAEVTCSCVEVTE